mmetsp:Transcript_33715/g.87593  ORF Transcript_33715/g.87593 Transcript_33715/m.87593 type:complete len:633 (-) Transcript_33715:102-2000(-)
MSSTVYKPPEWAEEAPDGFGLDLISNGSLQLSQPLTVDTATHKGGFVVGRHPRCTVVLETLEPTASRFHAAFQFNASGELFLTDLGSSHGTKLNGERLAQGEFRRVFVGDQIHFCAAAPPKCMAVVTGPEEHMREEGEVDISELREQAAQERKAMEEDLFRRKRERKIREIRARQQQADTAKLAAAAREQMETQYKGHLAADKAKMTELQEVTWGMGAEATKTDGEEYSQEVLNLLTDDGIGVNIDKMRSMELTEKQNKMVEKMIPKQNKLANLRRERERLETIVGQRDNSGLVAGIRGSQFMDAEDLKDKGVKLHSNVAKSAEQLDGVLQKIEAIEDELVAQQDNLFLSLGLRKPNEVQKLGKRKLEMMDTRLTDDADDFFDRAAEAKRKDEEARLAKRAEDAQAQGLPEISKVETYETLKPKVDILSSEKCRLQAQLAMLQVQLSQAPDEEEDELDAFMKSNDTKLQTDKQKQLNERLELVQQRFTEASEMLRISEKNRDEGVKAAKRQKKEQPKAEPPPEQRDTKKDAIAELEALNQQRSSSRSVDTAAVLRGLDLEAGGVIKPAGKNLASMMHVEPVKKGPTMPPPGPVKKGPTMPPPAAVKKGPTMPPPGVLKTAPSASSDTSTDGT